MPATTTWLLTGVTGGLGAKILHDMLAVHHFLPSSIIATARKESRRLDYESKGLGFRVLDYEDPKSLSCAMQNVENFLFMSSSERDSSKRIAQHKNVVEAANAAGVHKIWYVSLAFGGYRDTSEIGFQQAHYATEHMLKESGLEFVSLRAGVYADAFPLFLNWYPSSKEILLPTIAPPLSEGKVAFATRDELGEAMANLFVKGFPAFPAVKPQTAKNIVLLTSTETNSMVDLVSSIRLATSSELPIRYLSPGDWIAESATDDEGGKPRAWFEARLVFMQGIAEGDAEMTSEALTILLGRRPEIGVGAVERMVRADPGYTWHQNHMNRS